MNDFVHAYPLLGKGTPKALAATADTSRRETDFAMPPLCSTRLPAAVVKNSKDAILVTVSSGFAVSYLPRITGPGEALLRLFASLRDRPVCVGHSKNLRPWQSTVGS